MGALLAEAGGWWAKPSTGRSITGRLNLRQRDSGEGSRSAAAGCGSRISSVGAASQMTERRPHLAGRYLR